MFFSNGLSRWEEGTCRDLKSKLAEAKAFIKGKRNLKGAFSLNMIRFTIPPCYLFKFLLSFQNTDSKETGKVNAPSRPWPYFNDPIHIRGRKCGESARVPGILAASADYFITSLSPLVSLCCEVCEFKQINILGSSFSLFCFSDQLNSCWNPGTPLTIPGLFWQEGGCVWR